MRLWPSRGNNNVVVWQSCKTHACFHCIIRSVFNRVNKTDPVRSLNNLTTSGNSIGRSSSESCIRLSILGRAIMKSTPINTMELKYGGITPGCDCQLNTTICDKSNAGELSLGAHLPKLAMMTTAKISQTITDAKNRISNAIIKAKTAGKQQNALSIS